MYTCKNSRNGGDIDIEKKKSLKCRVHNTSGMTIEKEVLCDYVCQCKLCKVVARVARIGVTLSRATKIELTAPAKTPIIVPSTQAIIIQLVDKFPASSILVVITHEATRAAAFEIETIERSIPPVSIESINAILKIAISGI